MSQIPRRLRLRLAEIMTIFKSSCHLLHLLLTMSLWRLATRLRYYAPAPRAGSIERWCASDVWRLSVAYIGPKSRTERPRKTKIGTEVAHLTCNSQGRGHIVVVVVVVVVDSSSSSNSSSSRWRWIWRRRWRRRCRSSSSSAEAAVAAVVFLYDTRMAIRQCTTTTTTTTTTTAAATQGLKWSKKEAGSLPQSEVECPSPESFIFVFDLKMASFVYAI